MLKEIARLAVAGSRSRHFCCLPLQQVLQQVLYPGGLVREPGLGPVYVDHSYIASRRHMVMDVVTFVSQILFTSL